MAPLHLLLVVCFIGGISAQRQGDIFFDIGSEIRQSTNFGNHSVALPTQATAGRRRSCAAGSTLYFTDGTSVVDQSSGNVILTAPAGRTISSITCVCNLLAVALQTNVVSDGLWIQTIFLDRDYIIVQAESDAVQEDVLITYVPQTGRLVIVSRTAVWTISASKLTEIDNAFSFARMLTGLVDISASTNANVNTRGFDVFIITVANTFATASWDGSAETVTTNDGSTVPFELILAIATADNDIYLLIGNLFDRIWSIKAYTIAEFSSSSTLLAGVLVLGGTATSTLTAVSPRTSIHGLQVCGTACRNFNCDPPCNCGSSPCGGCTPTSPICQCDNAVLEPCIYSDDEIADMCVECPDPIDASVFVRNPLALRRGGPDIDIVAVSTVDADISFKRYVDTGRYFSPNLPQNDAFLETNGPPLWIRGFSIPVQNTGRGRRFGVYAARFDPADGNAPTYIPSIATENSGFTNTLYSYTINPGRPVSLVASFQPKLERFIDSVQWAFSRVDSVTGEHFGYSTPPCIFDPNRLTCLLNVGPKDTFEGVYEAFRPGRRLRNWHPIFYLSVRRCVVGVSGPNCDIRCDVCESDFGRCDSDCGGCVCFPGWSGPSCEIPCATADLVGGACNIRCSDVFPGNEDCKGLLISRPTAIPFACRSGLRSPMCIEDCPEKTFGPNCGQKCEDGCDPRTGEDL